MRNIQYQTVKEVNEHIKEIIENDDSLTNIVVRGEIANVTDRGHIYMTIKDEDGCSLKAVLFRGYRTYLSFEPVIGDEVLLYGSIELYALNGTYQLIVKNMIRYGDGAKLIELEKLRKKLQSEGLFDESHKLSIPKYPQTIAIITAKSGAAIHDIIKNIYRRFPIVNIKFFNSSVQGELAPKELNEALKKAIEAKPDVIIIGRGGGDKEDLSAFNDEELVRNVYASNIPIISAVGHESDYSLIDYVSDLRASTPTDAAIKATPNINDILLGLNEKEYILNRFMNNVISSSKNQIDKIKAMQFFKNPTSYYEKLQEVVKNYKLKLNNELINVINDNSRILSNLKKDLNYGESIALESHKSALNALKIKLEYASPKKALDRGYSLTTNEEGKIITNINDVSINEQLKIIVKDGIITSTVIKKE